VRDLLELYALGALEPEERVGVNEHLQTDCRRCAESLGRALALNAAVLASVPEAAPPGALRKRVVGLTQPERTSWLWQAAGGLAAALAVVAVWLGIDSRRKTDLIAEGQRERAVLERQLGSAHAALSFLQHPETRPASGTRDPGQPSGTYFVNPRNGVLLIASRLPQLRPGQTYEMWVIPKGQAPRPAGLFRPDEGGGAVHLQPGPVDATAVQALAITVEPEGGSTAPTTTPMLVSPVAE
jgi:anti-sigma-K factor RskA